MQERARRPTLNRQRVSRFPRHPPARTAATCAGKAEESISARHRLKRDVARQRSLEADLDHSSARLGDWLAAGGPSPSREVQRMEMVEHLTPVPNAPAYVDGVVFSRGKVVPAVNLRTRFGFERAAYDLKTRLIVVSHADRSVGLLVDSAREFLSIPTNVIQPPPEVMAATSGSRCKGSSIS